MGLSRKNISEPDKNGFQVKIVRRHKQFTRYFAYKSWGGRKNAFKAANNWRDQMLVILKNTKRRAIKAATNNKSTGVLGVCKTHSHDNRKNLTYLVYGVSWIDHKGKKYGKTFRVCNINKYDGEMDLLAFQQALKFRREWEDHADNDTLHLFDPSTYQNWREEKIDK